jgi:uncharacterized protein YeaO (DUF488 family)
MPLEVFSCPIDGRDEPDLLIISRSQNEKRVLEGVTGGHRELGLYFSPSKGLQAARWKRCRFNLDHEHPEEWELYRESYVKEMRESYKRHRQAWLTLLSWQRVVIACSVKDHERSARFVLADEILRKLGANYLGEI